MKSYAIGVDLGGTTLKAGIVTEDGSIVHEQSVMTEADKGPERVAHQIAEIIETISKEVNGTELRGIGIATPGMLTLDGNTVQSPPNFKNWHSFPLRDAVRDLLRNDVPLRIENDANAAALAEARFGAGRGEENFLFVIWGTGIGGGIILDGEIYHGPHGGAGEFGHSSIDYKGPVCNCGNIGCIESFIGQRYLSARAASYLHDKRDSLVWELVGEDEGKIEPKVLYEAAVRGDEAAAHIMTEAGELLGCAISSFMNTMNFSLAIVGGGISAAGDLVFRPMNERVQRSVMAPLRSIARVIPAKLGNQAGILGAAGLVM